MAQMHPNRIDSDTKSNAECLLYETFRDDLDDSYTVFHSVAWQAIDVDGRPRDGEADFIIAHPDRGVLVLEAKGGSIRHDPRVGWGSIDHTGHAHLIKDPFAQSRDSKYVLLDLLKQMAGQEQRYINIGHAVAFPDVVVDREWSDLHGPRQIILDATDLADPSGWVGRALAYWRGQGPQRETAPGEAVMQALMGLLGQVRELHPAMWGDFVREREELIRLTEQQYRILDALSRQRRAAICGCAGSGKTMLAVEKASRLARQGFRVLLTCFNRHLAADLRDRVKSDRNLDIVHFHGLCYDLARQANRLPLKQDDRSFYDRQLPEALMDAADGLGIRYDAVVVDEGQDFLEDWWIPLQTLLRDPDDGILYVFYDDNQRLYTRQSAFPIQQEPYLLTLNCRNTQHIHRVVSQFYDAEIRPSALGPAGRQVEVEYYDLSNSLQSVLRAILLRLTREEHVPSNEIAVLTPLREKSRLWRHMPSGIELTDTWPPSPNQVYCTTVYDFKGLECAVVILTELEDWVAESIELEPLMYVGCSRARSHLILLLPRGANAEIRQALFQAQSLHRNKRSSLLAL